MIADFAGRPPGFAASTNAFIAIGQRARKTSDSTLVAVEAAGFACVLAVFAWAPHTLDLALPAGATGAFGLWGVTEHMRVSHRRMFKPVRFLLRTFQSLVAAGGIAAAIATGYALIGRLMGTWVL